MNEYTLIQGDCLDILPTLRQESIDMILCDLPYGKIAAKWDVVIPFEPLWKEYSRVIKRNGIIVLFGVEPFSSHLRLSNLKNYKYDWVWEKDKPTNFARANKEPMRYYENIMIFYKKQPTFNKQLIPRSEAGKIRYKTSVRHNNRKIQGTNQVHRGKNDETFYNRELKNPSNIIYFNTGRRQNLVHPTQKPVALFEYLIKTYTNEGDMVLDNCIGSGTTMEACQNLGRSCIGIELSQEYCEIVKERCGIEVQSSCQSPSSKLITTGEEK